jgi:competence protein ComEA
MDKSIRPYIFRAKSLILSSPNKIYYALGLVGIFLVIAGLILGNKVNFGSSKVEVLQTPDPSKGVVKVMNNNSIIIDVSGAVENPGVYHLSSNDRVEDAIIASGGLSLNADRTWIDKNLNKAAKLIDGQKIYVPTKQSEVLSAKNSSPESNVVQYVSSSDSSLVNINIAGIEALDTLPGIGQVYGQKIVDHRPYSDINELISKKIIPQSTFNKIKDLISVY